MRHHHLVTHLVLESFDLSRIKTTEFHVGAIASDRSDQPRFRVGLNTGPVLVGNVGGEAMHSFTAIGDTVNVASRLQDLTKEYTCQLVISEQVAQRAGADVALLPRHELNVRNRSEALRIYVIADVAALPLALKGI
jgi:adenylate cyclase